MPDTAAQAASQTSDGRMQALAAATTALNLYSNQKEISDAASALASGDVSKAASISISVGSSKSQNTSNSAGNAARGSSITAGGDVTISALGAGQDSNLTVRGSTIAAGNNAKLLADNEIQLLAAKNDYTQTSSNSSSSGSIGISLGASTGVTLSASKARGNSDGTDTSYTNTFIQAGNTASLNSGGDTTLKGAVVTANQVKADVGGDLNIQSLQDTSTFTGQQSSSGGSITIGPGFIPTGGGFSASKSNINSNYASVAQQSGIKAGDGGFQVKAAGNTHLKGGVIASTEAAVALARNTFTTGSLSFSDIRNSASYQGKAYGVSVDVGQQAGKFGVSGVGAGIGSAKGEASSVTTAGISGIAGNTAVRSTDAEAGIQRIFDAAKVQREINAQVQITQAFGKEGSKAAGTYANNMYDEALKRGDTAAMEQWREGGTARVGLHALVGGLSGGVSGAAGAAAGAYVSPQAVELLNQLAIPPEVSQALVMLTGATVGGAVGGASGAAAGFNEAGNNAAGSVLGHGAVDFVEFCARNIRCQIYFASVAGGGAVLAQIANRAAEVKAQNPGISDDGAFTVALSERVATAIVTTISSWFPSTSATGPNNTGNTSSLPNYGGSTTTPGTPLETNNNTGGNQTVNPAGDGMTAGGGYGAGTQPTFSPVVMNINGANQTVNLPSVVEPGKAIHILTGDSTGGGHLWPGAPGKTPFPQSWDADKVLGNISDVATDPKSIHQVQSNGRIRITGVRDGVEIRVIVEPPSKGGRIVTAHPVY